MELGPGLRSVADRMLRDSARVPLVLLFAPVASGKTWVLDDIAARAATVRQVRMVRGGAARAAEIEALVADDTWGGALGGAEGEPALIVVHDADLLPLPVLERMLLRAEHDVLARSPRLILSCSRMLDSPLSGLRMRGRMAEYGMADLNLTHVEAAAMLRLDMAEMMSPAFRMLMRRSEGWIGAWQLIRNVLRDGHGLEAAARWMHGDAREFVSYFGEQVMAPLRPELQRFITLTAPIWPLDDALVGAIHGDAGPATLQEAIRACPFLGTQKPGGPPPRPNPLFVEYLIARGRRDCPADQRAAFSRAGDVFRDRTDWPRAAQSYILAGAPDQAADLLDAKSDEIFARFGDVLLVQDDGDSLYNGLANVPQSGPAHDLIRGTFLREQSGAKGIRADHVKFEDFLADFGRDDLRAVRTGADYWLEGDHGSALQRATIANALAASHLADLRLADMQQALERATSASVAARSPFLGAWSAMYWVFLHLERGNLDAAKRTLLSTLQEPAVRGLVRHTVSIMLAACERLLGHTAAATELVSGSIDLSSRHATSDTMVLGWSTAGRCVLGMDGLDGALGLLDRAARIAGRRSGDRSRYMLRVAAIQLTLQAGDRSRLPMLRDELEQIRTVSGKVQFGRRFDEDLRFTSARLLLALGNTREALAIAQPIVQRTQIAGRARRWTEAMLIRVGAAIADGNRDAACRLFWQCEAGIGGVQLHQLIRDERAMLLPIAEMLHEQVTRPGFTAAQAGLVTALISGAAGPLPVARGRMPGSPAAIPPIAGLTRKERDIMALVAGGLSNHEIGGRMGVSEVTVKWHLRNVFQKLDVKSRTAAIARMAGA